MSQIAFPNSRVSSEKGILKTFRQQRATFEKFGDQMLNAADFEATRNLPVGRGRKACDDMGEYDKDAPRPRYDPSKVQLYPRHVHHKMNENEYVEVRDEVQEAKVLATGVYSLTALERRSSFRMTDAATSDIIQREMLASQARIRELENRLHEQTVAMARTDQSDTIRSLQAQMQDLMARISGGVVAEAVTISAGATDDDDDDDEDEDEEEVKTASVVTKRGRRK